MSAPVSVKVQAMWRLWPRTTKGTPGALAPASVVCGVSIWTRYQSEGESSPRWGSPASSGAPVALHFPETAHSFEAVSGSVKGAGKRGRTRSRAAAKREAVARELASDASIGVVSCEGGHKARMRSGGRWPRSAKRASSVCQLPERERLIVSPQRSELSGVQGRGAPKKTNWRAAKRPRAAIQAFTPRA